MTRVVLSVGSNVGDRIARLQAVVDGAGGALQAASPVYETDPWGGVEQCPFLNAVLIADDQARDERGWLRWAHELEQAADRVRGQRWGPRTLDVDLVACYQTFPAAGTAGPDRDAEVISHQDDLTLPHPLAHLRAFVMVPWLAVEPDAELTVAGQTRPVVQLLAELEPAERASVRMIDLALNVPSAPTDPHRHRKADGTDQKT